MWLTISQFSSMQSVINNLLIYRLEKNNEGIAEKSVKMAQRGVCIIMDKDVLDTDSSCTEQEISLIRCWLKSEGV